MIPFLLLAGIGGSARGKKLTSPAKPLPASSAALSSSADEEGEESKQLRELHLDQDFWSTLWRSNTTRWHRDHPNRFLEQYLGRLPPPSLPVTEGSHERRATKILVPLCGATVDLLYLASLGYHAIGVEYVDYACETFFHSNYKELSAYEKIPYPDDNITLYAAKYKHHYHHPHTHSDRSEPHNHGLIEIYRSDIYNPSLNVKLLNGPVDSIWDRASFVAIRRQDRLRYVTKLMSLLPAMPYSHTPSAASSSSPAVLGSTMNHAEVREMLKQSQAIEAKKEAASHPPIQSVEWLLAVFSYPQHESVSTPLSILDHEVREYCRVWAERANKGKYIPEAVDLDTAIVDQPTRDDKLLRECLPFSMEGPHNGVRVAVEHLLSTSEPDPKSSNPRFNASFVEQRVYAIKRV